MSSNQQTLTMKFLPALAALLLAAPAQANLSDSYRQQNLDAEAAQAQAYREYNNAYCVQTSAVARAASAYTVVDGRLISNTIKYDYDGNIDYFDRRRDKGYVGQIIVEGNVKTQFVFENGELIKYIRLELPATRFTNAIDKTTRRVWCREGDQYIHR